MENKEEEKAKGTFYEEYLNEAKAFFETYRKEIGRVAKAGEKIVHINFEDFSAHSPELAENFN